MTEAILERLMETYLPYSFPCGSFTFQGGEPTLAGAAFFERVCEFQVRYGKSGQVISNALQTNGVLLNQRWCELFRAYNWLIGLSLDGPEELHNRYRLNKAGQGTWKQVIGALERLQRNAISFNVLCVLSEANVDRPGELYRFFRALGIEHLQFIPLAEFDEAGQPLPFSITPEQYGSFLVKLFELWWPDRKQVRIRFFDNVTEALAGLKPSTCTMHEKCDSYVVVEYNGDVYPCDFFVEQSWRLGNVMTDSWEEIAAREPRRSFAAMKAVPHQECSACEHAAICHSGCPKLRNGPSGRFEDLDYFCESYKVVLRECSGSLAAEVKHVLSAPIN